MTFSHWFQNTAVNLFGKIAEGQIDSFGSLRKELQQSNFGIQPREWISITYLSLLVSLVIGFPLSYTVLYLFEFTMAEVILFGTVSAVIIGMIVFFIMLKYPATKATERRKNIDMNLPFAVLYMNTIAGTGAPPYTMFKLLADFTEYGEVSKEAQEIVEDVEALGQDIESALQRAARKTPSPIFSELLWSMITTIVRGGDMRSLLQAKAQFLMDAHRRKIKEYTNDLGLYVEAYITLVIVGSIFAIVLSTVFGVISGFGTMRVAQELLVFVFLPLASTVFIVILKLTSPLA